jgi:elongation factor G
MKDIPVSNIRNFAFFGHSGSGKTTLTDALAFKLGLNDRQGSVDNGSSVSDIIEEEKTRRCSILAATFTAEYKHSDGNRYGIVFTDAPGYLDFYGQVLGAGSAVDAVLITVDAVSGVQVGTRRAWQACKAAGIVARGFVITGLDKENANFGKALAAIQENFGNGCVPAVVPAQDGSLQDILASGALTDDLQNFKNQLLEAAAETDEALIEKYLGGGTLSADEIAKGLTQAVAAGSLHPVFACAASKGLGIPELLEGIGRLLPSPTARIFKDSKGHDIPPDPNAPFVGLVWRTMVDPFIGQLSYVRVVSGSLTPHAELHNTNIGGKENVSALVTTVGKKQTHVEKAGPGEIVAIPKLKATKTGHTLSVAGCATQLPPIPFPSPVMYMAISAKTQADEDKMGTAIHRLCEQDPTLLIEKNAETKQVVIKGLGDVHIDVAVHLMKSQSNVAVELSTPKVPYRETVTALGDGHYRHKKQTGGRGQFGEVYLRVDPKRAGEEEWFLDEIVGGTIPNNFKPAVHKGVVEGMLAGSVAGYPVQDVKVHMYDGSYHDVDSSEIAFKIAGSRAFRDAMSKAHPVLLEPIMTIRVTIPEHFMGAINGDLTHKRGRVLGLEVDGNTQIITAEAPLSELFKYAAELRSLTGGQGSFDMTFTRYDIVPSNVAQKIIAEAAKHHKADEEE